LSRLLRFVIVILVFFVLVLALVFILFIVIFAFELSIELRRELLVDVTLAFFAIFITVIAGPSARCPCIAGLGMTSRCLRL